MSPRWLSPFYALRTRRWMFLSWGAASICIVLILFQSNRAPWLEEAYLRSGLFKFREIVGREPKLSDDLAIFVLGDTSAAAIQGTDLPMNEWAYLFRSLERQGVRDVLVDKIFSFDSASSNPGFLKEMRKLKRAPITGAFSSQYEIPGRFSIPSDHRALSLGQISFAEEQRSTSPIYGPTKTLLEVLDRPGLVNYENGTVPLMVVKSQTAGIPFAAAYLAESRSFSPKGLVLNGVTVPQISPGKVLVNFLSPKALKNKKYSLQALREDLQTKAASQKVRPGSTALLLTAFYTGGTQPIESPFGEVPSGTAQIALANSVLTGQWIKPFDYPVLAIIVISLLGIFTATILRSLTYSLGLAVIEVILIGGLSVGLFTLDSTLFPISISLCALTLSFLPAFLQRLYHRRKQNRMISDSLEGLVPEKALQSMLKNGARKFREPQNYHLSVLFLDVVGFSELVEKTTPKQTFALLKDLLSEVTQIVHQHGGIVDKTLGDGMLCFFGLGMDGAEQKDHADQAVRCAIAIQTQSIKRVLSNPAESPVLPFRIGINSGSVIMGDLGSMNRIDLTVIGSNVNMAKRYETAAEPFGIVIGEATMGCLTAEDLIAAKAVQRWYPIKHQADPVRAFVFDAVLRKLDWEQALAKYRQYRGLSRKDDRIAPLKSLTVDCGWFGQGELLNYSSHGLCLSLPRYLGVGINLKCELVFSEKDRTVILGEVRWGSIGPGGSYLHGIKILGLPDTQKLLLLEKIKTACGVRTEKASKVIPIRRKRSSKKAA